MSRRWSYDRPSAYDLSYLARETDEQPLHFVVQLQVDGQLTLEQVRAHVAAHLPSTPAMLRTLRRPLLTGSPVWVDDPHFDIARHVVLDEPATGAHVDPDEVLTRMTTTRLPRTGPLWRLVVVPAADRTWLYLCVQHAMMDGGLLVATLPALFADTATADTSWRPRRAPSRASLLVLLVLKRLVRLLGRGRPAVAPGDRKDVVRSPGPTSGARSLAFRQVPLDRAAAVRRRSGVTVNDLYLTAVAGGLRRHLDEPRDLLAIIPRDIRPAELAMQIGNRHRSMVVRLPVLQDDLDAALADVHEQVTAKRTAERTAGAERRVVEVVCTNVRLTGQHVVAGHPVTDYRIGLPLQESALGVVALSYGGALTLGFTAEAAAYPDLDALARSTAEAWDALVDLGEAPAASAS